VRPAARARSISSTTGGPDQVARRVGGDQVRRGRQRVGVLGEEEHHLAQQRLVVLAGASHSVVGHAQQDHLAARRGRPASSAVPSASQAPVDVPRGQHVLADGSSAPRRPRP
jgi:hypothetical protein